jgi:oxygen-independent coproporphyrinogen-3 oxidase
MYKDLPHEDEQLAHLMFIDQFMRGRGFTHYEISNFAKPGRQARHNLVYWTGGSYLSFGPSAHSYDAERSVRFKNVSSLHQYAKRLESGESPVEWEEGLTAHQKELEKWMLAIRLDHGFERTWLASVPQQNKAKMLIQEGLLEVHPADATRIRATPRGFALSDAIVKELS